MEELCICLEELDDEAVEGMVVDGGVWVEEFEVDINEALLVRDE